MEAEEVLLLVRNETISLVIKEKVAVTIPILKAQEVKVSLILDLHQVEVISHSRALEEVMSPNLKVLDAEVSLTTMVLVKSELSHQEEVEAKTNKKEIFNYENLLFFVSCSFV